eukprot:765759-Hanusia_phi.AAC.1
MKDNFTSRRAGPGPHRHRAGEPLRETRSADIKLRLGPHSDSGPSNAIHSFNVTKSGEGNSGRVSRLSKSLPSWRDGPPSFK